MDEATGEILRIHFPTRWSSWNNVKKFS